MNKPVLVNYETKTSSTYAFNVPPSSSSPGSFPEVMGNGVFIDYKSMMYCNEIEPDFKELTHTTYHPQVTLL